MNVLKQIGIYCLFIICCFLAFYFFAVNAFPNWAFSLYLFSVGIFFLRYLPIQKCKYFILRYRIDLVISIGLFIATLCLYLYRITEITPGVWGDEVSLGWMVEDLLHRHMFTPFFAVNLGHPTPLVYLSALFITIMGRSIISLRIVSVIFGAFSVVAFYLFLRLFFNKILSFSGGLLLATSYVLIIVSRFAYEMSAAVFFFICSLFAYVLFFKKMDVRRVVFLGFFLGLGIYTYLAFRAVFPIFLIATLLPILKKGKNKIQIITFLFMSILLVLFPLITYSIHNPKDVSERIHSLNVFGQNLPTIEVIKELKGASFRTLTMFFFTGDPNPRQNPAGTTPFDIFTSIFFFVGLIYLFIKKRWIGSILTLLIMAILFTEIITLERIPEFHYYGLGHPNTLRISPLVPIVIFAVTWVIKLFSDRFTNGKYKYLGIGIVVCLISGINLNWYYNQKLNTWIYTTNFVVPLKVVDYLNSQMPNNVALSSTFYENQHIKYFLDPKINVFKLTIPLDCTFKDISQNVSIVSFQDLSPCSQDQFKNLVQNPFFIITPIVSPWSTLDAIEITKK